MSTEVILRFNANDEVVSKIIGEFYAICEKEPGVKGWGLVDQRREGSE